MTLDQARKILNSCTREELRDHAFGDRELSWFNGNNAHIGYGYAGSTCNVCVIEGDTHHSFEGDEAAQLIRCGSLRAVERNDETGPDTYYGA